MRVNRVYRIGDNNIMLSMYRTRINRKKIKLLPLVQISSFDISPIKIIVFCGLVWNFMCLCQCYIEIIITV